MVSPNKNVALPVSKDSESTHFFAKTHTFHKNEFFVTKPKNVERKERSSRAFEQKETKKISFGANFIQMI